MKFFKTITVENAYNEILKRYIPYEDWEEVSLLESLGRISAEDIFSDINLPPFDKSIVDGYAIISSDSLGASENNPISLLIQKETPMGKQNFIEIDNSECVYIPTGGMLPKNSNSVVMIEQTTSLDNFLFIKKDSLPGQNIIKKGSEVKKGDLLVKKDSIITPNHIAVLSSIGLKTILIKRKIIFSIISIGDELVKPSHPLKIGKIYDINTYSLSAAILSLNGEIKSSLLLKDNFSLLVKHLKELVKTSNIVLISGGSSVGNKDFTDEAIRQIGAEIFIHGLAIKPGKPTIVASLDNKFIFGLPGHPQSSINIFNTFIAPIFLEKKHKKLLGKLSEHLHGDPGKDCYINVFLTYEKDFILITPNKSKSATVKPLIDSDGYIIIPHSREGFEKNEIVEVFLYE